MTFGIKPSYLTTQTWYTSLACGMGADSKLFFALHSRWDHYDFNSIQLIHWGGDAHWISQSRIIYPVESFRIKFEFVPKPELHLGPRDGKVNYVFDLKVTSHYQAARNWMLRTVTLPFAFHHRHKYKKNCESAGKIRQNPTDDANFTTVDERSNAAKSVCDTAVYKRKNESFLTTLDWDGIPN